MEYKVLGHRLRVKTDEENASVKASEVVELVAREAAIIKNSHPQIDESQIAVLVAMKLAEENLSLKRDFDESLDELKLKAANALQYIEEVSPSTL